MYKYNLIFLFFDSDAYVERESNQRKRESVCVCVLTHRRAVKSRNCQQELTSAKILDLI